MATEFPDALRLFARDFSKCWVDPGPMYWRPVYEGPADAPIDDPARHPDLYERHEFVPTGLAHLERLRLKRAEWLARLRERWYRCRSSYPKRFAPELDELLDDVAAMLERQSPETLSEAEQLADTLLSIAKRLELAVERGAITRRRGRPPGKLRAKVKELLDQGLDTNSITDRIGISADYARQIKSRTKPKT
jgi:hypothetical protein